MPSEFVSKRLPASDCVDFSLYASSWNGFHCLGDVDFGDRSRVNESPHSARLGRGLHHETHQALSGADHPQALAEGFCDAVNGRAADRPEQDRRRRLPRDRGDAADLPPLETAVRGNAGREARQLTQLEKETARLKKLLAEAELEKAMLKDLIAP